MKTVNAAWISLGLLGFAASAAAQPLPDPSQSTLPAVIRLVGERTGTVDPSGSFAVTVRDLGNTPIAGAQVQVRFDDCAQITLASPQPDPGVTLLQCSPGRVTAVTGASGIARFTLSGAVAHRAAAEPIGPCATIYSSNGGPQVLLGSARVACFDEDGVNGVRANDLSLMICDFVDLLGYHQRSDFDGDGGTFGDNDDLTAWFANHFGERSEETGTRCDLVANSTGLARIDSDQLFLRWNECPDGGGLQSRNLICTSNSGASFQLVATLRAPAGVDALTGIEAELDLIGNPGAPIMDWWRVEATGCRAGSLGASSGAGTFCTDAFASSASPAVVADYPHPNGLSNYVRIRVVVAGGASGTALNAGDTYELFRLNLNRAKTTGTGACAGCNAPVAVVLRSVRLTQPAVAGGGCGAPAAALAARGDGIASATGDFLITSRFSGDNVAYANGFTTNVEIEAVSRTYLGAVMPNPMGSQTAIPFHLDRLGLARLTVYDLVGRKVRELVNESLGPGTHHAVWDGRNDGGLPVPNGAYYVHLVAAGGVDRRTVIVKR